MHCCFLVLPFQEQQAPFQNTTFWNTESICDSPTLIEQLSLFTSTKPMKCLKLFSLFLTVSCSFAPHIHTPLTTYLRLLLSPFPSSSFWGISISSIFWCCCPQLGIKSLSKKQQQQKPKNQNNQTKSQQTISLAVDTNILLIVDFLKLPSVSRKYRWAKQKYQVRQHPISSKNRKHIHWKPS